MWTEWPLWLRLLAEVVAGLAIALLLRRFVCCFCYVKGSSMRETLQNGEVVFALRRGVCGKLKRFDVVLCRYPGRKGLFVKRIVGLPGESISMEEGALRINGEAVQEHFPLRPSQRTMEAREIPCGSYFLMGDNRMGSHDSRSPGVGPIGDGEIVAVVKCVLLPPRRVRRI